MFHVKQKRPGAQRVLDYYDVLLREHDVALLEGPHWLNDQIVAFYFEYLEREGLRPPPHLAGSMLLLPPATSFLLMHSDAAVAKEILAPLKPAQRGLVLFAVNDNPDLDRAAGGSHWSLLVFHRPSNTLRHYDSSPSAVGAAAGSGGNAAAARQLAAAVGPTLVPSTPTSGGTSTAAAAAGGTAALPTFVDVAAMPRQTNGYDCGMYVLAVARAVGEWWSKQPPGERAEAGVDSEATAAAKAEVGAGSGSGVSRGRGGAAALGDGLSPGGAGVAAGGREEGSPGPPGVQDGGGGEEGYWQRQERGMATWLSPAFVRQLREEVLALVRDKARGT